MTITAEELGKRLLARSKFASQVEPLTEETVTSTQEEVNETVTEETQEEVAETTDEVQDEPKPENPWRKKISEAGFGIDESLDDETLADSIAKGLAEKDAQVKALQAELAAARQAAEASKALTEPPKESQVQEPVVTKENKAELRKWAKIDLDQDLKNQAEFDGELGVWKGVDKYGQASFEAARKLNEAVKEQNRRAMLMVSDPVAALEEAGIFDQISLSVEDKIEKRIKSFEEGLTKKQQEELAAAQEAAKEREGQEFFEKNKDLLFVVGSDGQIKKDPITGNFLLKPMGETVRELAASFKEDGIVDNARAMKRAFEIASKIHAQPEPPAESKKEAFLNKTRQTSETVKQSAKPIPAQTPPPAASGFKKKFLQMALEDPDNAEALGDLYQGN